MLFHLHPGLMARIDGNIMYLHAQPDGRLLDVGCGSGAWLKMMQELGWCVEGVDIDPSAVENAQKKGLNVRFGTLESQKYPDDHFHTVTINHVIEHVHDPWGLLRESCRIITPGGHLVVATPNTKSWGHGMFKEAWLYLDPPRHLHMFTPEGLRDLAERSGFSRVNVFTTVHAADLVFIGSRSIQRTGRFGKDGPQPRATNVRALGMQLIEWALLRVKPGLGEEIALIAEK